MVRLARWPKRYGFGVHSPFAYRLITDVIGEHAPYYNYSDLRKQEKQLAPGWLQGDAGHEAPALPAGQLRTAFECR